jgi:glycosyltransferase involved in cell wall biosynthesis
MELVILKDEHKQSHRYTIPVSYKKDATISIVTVVKDDFAGFLDTCNSVMLQNTDDFEWIIVDGSSNLDIADYISSKDFTGITHKYFQQEPKGIYSAMNYGLFVSSGKYIWYLNAGDYFTRTDALSIAISQIEEVERPLAFPVLHVTSHKLAYAISSPKIIQVSLDEIHAIVNHQGALLPRQSMVEVGGFDETYRLAGDSKLLDSIAQNHKFKFCKDFLVVFTHGGVSTASHREVWREIHRHQSRTFSVLQIAIRTLKSNTRTYIFSMNDRSLIGGAVFRILQKRSERLIHDHKINKNDLDIFFSE